MKEKRKHAVEWITSTPWRVWYWIAVADKSALSKIEKFEYDELSNNEKACLPYLLEGEPISFENTDILEVNNEELVEEVPEEL